MEHKNKEFGISTWAVDNRITVYILTLIIIVMGINGVYQHAARRFS